MHSTAPAASARARIVASSIESAVLADVDRERDHLDAEVVDHPAHRDRRVESPAVGQHDPLGHQELLLLRSASQLHDGA